jgi:antitoxin component of MazEF toxin-antitoxin module
MPTKRVVKLRRVGGCLVIGLPKDMAERLTLREGDRLELTVAKSGTLIDDLPLTINLYQKKDPTA